MITFVTFPSFIKNCKLNNLLNQNGFPCTFTDNLFRISVETMNHSDRFFDFATANCPELLDQPASHPTDRVYGVYGSL